MRICHFETTTEKNSVEVGINVEKAGMSEDKIVEITLDIKIDKDTDRKFVMSIDTSEERDAITIPNFNVENTVACLVARSLGHLAQEIMDCRNKGHTTTSDIIQCLRKKGLTINATVANILVTCFTQGALT